MTQGMTISEQAKTLAKKVLDQPATEHDIAVVERQLGRYPRGMVAVGARCVCGRPLAVANALLNTCSAAAMLCSPATAAVGLISR